MRLYVFVSEAVKLSDLVPILETSKISNAAHGITGLLSYSYGHYLQVIEGEEAKVATLIKNIQRDSRHQNMSEILDVHIDARIFSDWSMNLVPLLKRNESFAELVDYLNENIDKLSPKQKRLMRIFHAVIDKKIPKAGKANPFKPLSYSINEWPDFEMADPSLSILSLCGRLMDNPTCFRKLVEQKTYGSEEEVRLMLNQLNKAGYLTVTQQPYPEQIRMSTRSGYPEKFRLPVQQHLVETQLAAV